MDKYFVVCPYSGILYYSNKRNDLLIEATTWINLRDIVFSKRSQIQKKMYFIVVYFHLYEVLGQTKLIYGDKCPNSGYLWRNMA